MIPVFKPSIKRKDMDGVLTCLISDFIGHGERSREFLKGISAYLNTEIAFGFRDYSRGIGFSLDSLDLEKGSRIVISPLSPWFYFPEIVSRGFEVIYADIETGTGCMDPREIETLKDLSPSAILVHFPLGNIPDLEEIKSFGIPVIADISSAFGGDYKGVPFSALADILVLNLEAEGIITAGGGAVVMTAVKKTASVMSKIIKEVPDTSLITDISASLGIIQFNQLNSFLEKRSAVKEVFSVSLSKGRHKSFYSSEDLVQIPFSFPVLLEGHVQEVHRYARKKNITIKTAFENSSFVKFQIEDFPCPKAGSISRRTVLFPLYPSLSRKNIEIISRVLSTLP